VIHDLHERLDDLVADVPTYVVPDARVAWASGARRRARHRVGVVAAAAVVAALLAGAVAWLPHTLDPAPADPDGSGVDGYPTRVDKPWLNRDLPDAPGAVAGVVTSEDSSLSAVSPSGRVWRIERAARAAGFPMALSSDGRMLAYLEEPHRFVLRDLVDGTTTVADEVGDGASGGQRPIDPWGRYWVDSQSPAFWSPSNDRVFVHGMTADPQVRALVIGPGDTTVGLRAPRTHGERLGFPAGWTPGGDLVWIVTSHSDDSTRWAQAILTTTSGKLLHRVDLEVPDEADLGDGWAGQWSGSVSPDGTHVVLVSRGETLVNSLEDGSVVDTLPVEFPECGISWDGDQPRPSFAGSDVVAVRDDQGRPQIVVDPSFKAACATWAGDALSGDAHRGVAGRVLGSSNEWLTWHWQEIALGVVAIGGVAVLLVVRRRLGARAAAP
jgi:hypothetical protein